MTRTRRDPARTRNSVTLKAAKDAVRRVKEMTYDNAEDYLVRAQEAANFLRQTKAARKASASSSTRKASSPALAPTTKAA